MRAHRSINSVGDVNFSVSCNAVEQYFQLCNCILWNGKDATRPTA